MQQQQPFLFQTLAQQNHTITPVSHTIMLYGVKLSVAHSNDAVGVMLSPIHPFLKHCDRLVQHTGHLAWTLKYRGVKHTDTPGIRHGDHLVIVTRRHLAPPLLDTIANIANFHHSLSSLMIKASDQAANLNLDISIDEDREGIKIHRADKSASIYITHESDCLTILLAPLSTFFDKHIVWEGADSLGWKHGVIPLSTGNQLVNIKQGDGDCADIEFAFPEDCSNAQLVVGELAKIMSE